MRRVACHWDLFPIGLKDKEWLYQNLKETLRETTPKGLKRVTNTTYKTLNKVRGKDRLNRRLKEK